MAYRPGVSFVCSLLCRINSVNILQRIYRLLIGSGHLTCSLGFFSVCCWNLGCHRQRPSLQVFGFQRNTAFSPHACKRAPASPPSNTGGSCWPVAPALLGLFWGFNVLKYSVCKMAILLGIYFHFCHHRGGLFAFSSVFTFGFSSLVKRCPPRLHVDTRLSVFPSLTHRDSSHVLGANTLLVVGHKPLTVYS